MNIIPNYLRSPLQKIPAELREDFFRQTRFANLNRARMFAHANIWLTLFSIVPLTILNVYNVSDAVVEKYAVITGTMLFLSVIFFLRYRKPIDLPEKISKQDGVWALGLVFSLTFCVSMLVYVASPNNLDVKFSGLAALELLMLTPLFFHANTLGLWLFWMVGLFVLNASESTFTPEFIQVGNIVAISTVLAFLANRSIQHFRVDLFLQEQKIKKEIQENKHTNVQLQDALEEANSLSNEINCQNNKLTILNKQLDELFGMAAHDLKNPLSAILANTDLLKHHWEQLSEHNRMVRINKINELTEYMNIKIMYFLNVNELENRLSNSVSEVFSTGEAISKTVESMSELAESKNIAICFCPWPTDILLKGDKTILQDIVANLISNAIKYSPPDSQIHVFHTADDAAMTLSVADRGIGVLSEEKPLLFQKFQRLSAQPTGGETSSGLGLSIAKRLTEECFEGSLWHEDNPGGGSIFFMSAPLAQISHRSLRA